MGRHAHLVGSLPGGNAEDAMQLALDVVGPHLRYLPDGETGERFHWILHIEDALRAHPDLEVAKEGDWSDYDKTAVLKVRKGHRLLGANLDFGHVRYALASWPVFEQLREQAGLPDLSFLVGIPGDFDMAMFTLGPVGALRERRAFTEATVSSINRIHAALGRSAVFQLEIPAELVLLARLPARAQPAAAALLARGVAGLAAACPQYTRFGVHLCVGDMNHKAFGTMTDVAPLVQLANAIAARWPDGRNLEFVHAPFAGADVPPSIQPEFYQPLERLHLRSGTRFAAGFAHERQDIADQQRIRGWIDGLVGEQVDVAAACGLGRRAREAAEANLRRVAELVVD